ncbi:transposase [Actinomyces ruminis]|uniref:transposase n=1 Tax=Actinomyces ruminis TaxID=1937003 RepID=UPI00211E105F|nr:transposase [Actinomyces ruminis]
MASTIGTELSHETISKITDQIGEEVLAWPRRPLEALYPVILAGRDRGQDPRRSPCLQPGRTHRRRARGMDGFKHVLGIWVQAHEGAKFWAGVCARAGTTAAS